MRLSTRVAPKDVEEASRLVREATQQAATNPLTGKIDMDIITSGMSSTSRERVTHLVTIIKGHLVSKRLRDLAERA